VFVVVVLAVIMPVAVAPVLVVFFAVIMPVVVAAVVANIVAVIGLVAVPVTVAVVVGSGGGGLGRVVGWQGGILDRDE
jgi:hypothetical protein